VAAACGYEAVPPDDVAEAGESTKAIGSARVDTVVSFAFDGTTQELRSREIVDYAGGRSVSTEQQTGCRTIAIGDVTWTEMPRGAEGIPAGKRWVRYAYSGESTEKLFEKSLEPPEVDEDGVSHSFMFGFSSPTADLGVSGDYLEHVRALGAEPGRVGEEEVRAVPTTHYRAQVDAVRETRRELEAAGWKAANIERYLELVDPTTYQLDVWIDGEGLVRRVTTTFDIDDPDSRSVNTAEYFDFGIAVDIQPPSAAEVIEGDEWQRRIEEQFKAERDAWDPDDDGVVTVPGGFEPKEPASPPSCLD
jgi:hypothetical protein